MYLRADNSNNNKEIEKNSGHGFRKETTGREGGELRGAVEKRGPTTPNC